MDLKLVKNYEAISKDKAVLFCFPYAGGGASVYRSWIKKFQDSITVCPIQLPGREERIHEKAYTNMTDLVDELEYTILSLIQGEYMLWGHSMGAKIVYELEKRLEKHKKIAKCIFVSASRIPSSQEKNIFYNLPDQSFIKAIAKLGGTSKYILDNKEIMSLFMPMLRADFELDETYYDEKINMLHCAIIAFSGKKDEEIKLDEIEKWKNYTDNFFAFKIFKGGHFFIHDQENEIITEIRKYL